MIVALSSTLVGHNVACIDGDQVDAGDDVAEVYDAATGVASGAVDAQSCQDYRTAVARHGVAEVAA